MPRIEVPAEIPAKMFSRSTMFIVRPRTGSTKLSGGIPPASRNRAFPV